MLPGKKYAPEDVVKILRKRFWVIVVPWAVVAAGTAGVARKLPDLYRSTATIQVVPAQVPDSIVRSMTPVSFNQRLQVTQQAILSRTRLERIIQDFNLYQEERKTKLMEEVVDKMRKDIVVRPKPGDAFTVEYVGLDRVQVMKVTERLASYFKDESVDEGKRRAESTNSFVESQVDESRRKLVEIEDRLKKYQMSHSGEMPEQQGANMQAVQGISMTLNNIAQQLATDANQVATLQRLIEQAETPGDTTPLPMPTGSTPVMTSGTTAEQLANAKATLAFDLDVRRLGPENPEVKSLKTMIASLTKQLNDEALRTSTVTPAGVPVNPADKQRAERLDSMRTELETTKKRITANQAEDKRLRGLAAVYQAKIDSVPARAAELVDITREYETQKSIYNDNVKKREASSMSVNLERRQIGEQFNLLDPARVPEKPFSPDRLIINLLGILGGLALGLGMVGFIEYRDSTFRADYEIANVLGLPVLAVVPLMRSDAERRANFRKHLFLNLGLGSTVALCLAVLAYTFVR